MSSISTASQGPAAPPGRPDPDAQPANAPGPPDAVDTVAPVASDVASRIVRGSPITIDVVAPRDPVHDNTCDQCGFVLSSATPPSADVGDALPYFTRGTNIALCVSCVVILLCADDAFLASSVTTRALTTIVSNGGATLAAAEKSLFDMYNQGATSASVLLLFGHLKSDNWLVKFFNRLAWHPSTTLVDGRVEPFPDVDNLYATTMTTIAHVLLAIGVTASANLKSRLSRRASATVHAFNAAAQSFYDNCGRIGSDGFGPREHPIIAEVFNSGDGAHLWPETFTALVDSTPLATVSNDDRLSLIYYWLCFVERAARFGLLLQEGAYTTDEYTAVMEHLTDMFLLYIAAPFRVPVSMALTDPAHRVFIAFDGAIHRCVTPHEFVICLASMYVYLPWGQPDLAVWRDAMPACDWCEAVKPFACIVGTGVSLQSIRDSRVIYSCDYPHEWALHCSKERVRAAHARRLSDRNLNKAIKASAAACAVSAATSNGARRAARRAAAEAHSAVSRSTPTFSRIGSVHSPKTKGPLARVSNAVSNLFGSLMTSSSGSDDDSDDTVQLSHNMGVNAGELVGGGSTKGAVNGPSSGFKYCTWLDSRAPSPTLKRNDIPTIVRKNATPMEIKDLQRHHRQHKTVAFTDAVRHSAGLAFAALFARLNQARVQPCCKVSAGGEECKCGNELESKASKSVTATKPKKRPVPGHSSSESPTDGSISGSGSSDSSSNTSDSESERRREVMKHRANQKKKRRRRREAARRRRLEQARIAKAESDRLYEEAVAEDAAAKKAGERRSRRHRPKGRASRRSEKSRKSTRSTKSKSKSKQRSSRSGEPRLPRLSIREHDDDEDTGSDTGSNSYCSSDSCDGASALPVPPSTSNIGTVIDSAGAVGGLYHVPSADSQHGSQRVVNVMVDMPFRLADPDHTPSLELRREITTCIFETVGCASITFQMNPGDSTGFKRSNDNNVTAPYVGCRETFRFILSQAIERAKKMMAKMLANLRTATLDRLGTDVVHRARLHLNFYTAATAAWTTFRDGVLRRWSRAYDPTIGRASRIEINTQLCNYVNWCFRTLIRDNVLIVRWNAEFFADVRHRRAPTPSKSQLKDHIADAEVAALGAYQSGGAAPKPKDRSRDKRDKKRNGGGDGGGGRGGGGGGGGDACPHPSAHALFAGTCYRCGATDHMTPTCPVPRDESDMTPAQLAKYKAIKKKRDAAGKKRDDWFRGRRGRK